MAFVIDTIGNRDDANESKTNTLSEKNNLSTIDELKKFRDKLLQDIPKPKVKQNKTNFQATLTNAVLNDLVQNNKTRSKKKKKKTERTKEVLDQLKSASKTDNVKKALEKSVITSEFEQLHAVPSTEVSKRQLQKQRREERSKTKGKKWFDLPATELTDEVKQDLEVLQMRSVLDPKHFYKKNDLKVIPKYFQIGKVMDSPVNFYNSRLTNKERKKTLVDELLADAEFQKYNKRKYKEIIEEKQKTHYKAWRQAKRLKRKKK